jgi:manganese/zinc/iron transport system permease protein
MMALVVLVTVAGLQAVGLILVIAMLIIPAVAARFWTERLWMLVLIAGVTGGASGYLGSVISALLPRKPAGAVIVLTAGAVFALSMFFAPSRGVVASVVRRLRLRVRIAGDHLLELGHERGGSELPPAELDRLAAVRAWSPLFRRVTLLTLRRSGAIAGGWRRGLTILPPGVVRGARVHRNHLLWEQYLIRHADIAPSHVDWSVDQVEHVLAPEIIRELERVIGSAGFRPGAARGVTA